MTILIVELEHFLREQTTSGPLLCPPPQRGWLSHYGPTDMNSSGVIDLIYAPVNFSRARSPTLVMAGHRF